MLANSGVVAGQDLKLAGGRAELALLRSQNDRPNGSLHGWIVGDLYVFQLVAAADCAACILPIRRAKPSASLPRRPDTACQAAEGAALIRAAGPGGAWAAPRAAVTAALRSRHIPACGAGPRDTDEASHLPGKRSVQSNTIGYQSNRSNFRERHG
jgi:hypothetical protein